MALQGLGGEQCLCLADELGDVEAGLGAQGADQGDVDASDAEAGVGHVQPLVAGGVEGVEGSADGDRLADADVADQAADAVLLEAEADAGDRLLETRADEELVGGDGLRERHARKAEVAEPGRGAHQTSSSWMAGR